MGLNIKNYNIPNGSWEQVGGRVRQLFQQISTLDIPKMEISVGEGLSKDIDLDSPTYGKITLSITTDLLIDSGMLGLAWSTKVDTENYHIGTEAGINNSSNHLVAIGYQAGINNNATYSVSIGYQSGNSLATGDYPYVTIGALAGSGPESVHIGYKAGEAGGGGGNICIGRESGKALTQWANVAIGKSAMETATDCQHATAIGYSAMSNGKYPDFNLAAGSEAMRDAETCQSCVAIGRQTLKLNKGGDGNLAIGYQSLQICNGKAGLIELMENAGGFLKITTTGHTLQVNDTIYIRHTALHNGIGITITAISGDTFTTNKAWIGADSGGGWAKDDEANYNTTIGHISCFALTTGAQNTTIGAETGVSLTTGSGNVLIGYQVGGQLTTESDKLYIDNSDTATPLILGDFDANTIIINGTFTATGNIEGPTLNLINQDIGIKFDGISVFNIKGTNNTAIGSNAAHSITTGTYNTAIGSNAAYSITEGTYNIAIGSNAAYSITEGTYNTAIGSYAGYNLTTGHRNILIGYQAGEQLTVESDKLYIDNTNTTTPLILGDFDADTLTINGDFSVIGSSKLGDGGTTNYIEIKTDGELNLHGTARVKRSYNISCLALTTGGTAPNLTVLGNYPIAEFTIADNAFVIFNLPKDWASGTDLTVHINWAIDEAYAINNGEIRWQLDWSACPIDTSEALDAPIHSGNADTGDIDIPATAKYLTSNDLTIAAASLSAGDVLGLKFSRIAIADGNNPSGAEPAIINIKIEYTVDKLGEAI